MKTNRNRRTNRGYHNLIIRSEKNVNQTTNDVNA